MMTGFLRVLASGMMLLLALTTTTLVHRAGAYSSELTDSPVTGYTTDGTTAATDVPVTSDIAPVTSSTTYDTGGTSYTATEAPDTGDTSIAACAAESIACEDDTTCGSCYGFGEESDSALTAECKTFNALTSDAEGCEANLDEACCLDDLSEFECLDSDIYVDFYMCFLEQYGCTLDEITCDGDESTTEFDGAAAKLGSASTALAFATAFTALLPFLWG